METQTTNQLATLAKQLGDLVTSITPADSNGAKEPGFFRKQKHGFTAEDFDFGPVRQKFGEDVKIEFEGVHRPDVQVGQPVTVYVNLSGTSEFFVKQAQRGREKVSHAPKVKRIARDTVAAEETKATESAKPAESLPNEQRFNLAFNAAMAIVRRQNSNPAAADFFNQIARKSFSEKLSFVGSAYNPEAAIDWTSNCVAIQRVLLSKAPKKFPETNNVETQIRPMQTQNQYQPKDLRTLWQSDASVRDEHQGSWKNFVSYAKAVAGGRCAPDPKMNGVYIPNADSKSEWALLTLSSEAPNVPPNSPLGFWQANADVRQEFGSFDTFASYVKASKAGRCEREARFDSIVFVDAPVDAKAIAEAGIRSGDLAGAIEATREQNIFRSSNGPGLNPR